jgi:hypothetical protein
MFPEHFCFSLPPCPVSGYFVLLPRPRPHCRPVGILLDRTPPGIAPLSSCRGGFTLKQWATVFSPGVSLLSWGGRERLLTVCWAPRSWYTVQRPTLKKLDRWARSKMGIVTLKSNDYFVNSLKILKNKDNFATRYRPTQKNNDYFVTRYLPPPPKKKFC